MNVMTCVLHDVGWLRLVSSLQLQVSVAEYRLFYRALLQKRHMILRSLLIVATPYTWMWRHVSFTAYMNTMTCDDEILLCVCWRWSVRCAHQRSHQTRVIRGVHECDDSLKSYVSFAKEPYKRDDILQKRLASNTSYSWRTWMWSHVWSTVQPIADRVAQREVGGWGRVPFSRI